MQSRAISTNEEQRLAIDVEAQRFASSVDPSPFQLPATIAIVFRTAGAMQLNETTGEIQFFPDGSSTGGQILLVGANALRVVTVDWLTGLVTIDDEAP